jgi:hypothetical protein
VRRLSTVLALALTCSGPTAFAEEALGPAVLSVPIATVAKAMLP